MQVGALFNELNKKLTVWRKARVVPHVGRNVAEALLVRNTGEGGGRPPSSPASNTAAEFNPPNTAAEFNTAAKFNTAANTTAEFNTAANTAAKFKRPWRTAGGGAGGGRDVPGAVPQRRHLLAEGHEVIE